MRYHFPFFWVGGKLEENMMDLDSAPVCPCGWVHGRRVSGLGLRVRMVVECNVYFLVFRLGVMRGD